MRYFALVLIAALMSFGVCNFVLHDNLITYAKTVSEEVKIIDYEQDFQVIEIDVNDYNKLVKTLSLEIVKKFSVEDRVIIEGYSNKLNNYVLVDNMKTNIQISITDKMCLVGYPLIKNSF